jgi:hypothetical protein
MFSEDCEQKIVVLLRVGGCPSDVQVSLIFYWLFFDKFLDTVFRSKDGQRGAFFWFDFDWHPHLSRCLHSLYLVPQFLVYSILLHFCHERGHSLRYCSLFRISWLSQAITAAQPKDDAPRSASRWVLASKYRILRNSFKSVRQLI